MHFILIHSPVNIVSNVFQMEKAERNYLSQDLLRLHIGEYPKKHLVIFHQDIRDSQQMSTEGELKLKANNSMKQKSLCDFKVVL